MRSARAALVPCAALAALAALSAARAADWQPILTAPGEFAVVIDVGSIRERGAAVTASLRITYKREQHIRQERIYRSAQQLWEFDCKRARYALLEAKNFAGPDGTGELVASYSWPQDTGWSSTGASGESAAILHYVCAHAQGGGAGATDPKGAR